MNRLFLILRQKLFIVIFIVAVASGAIVLYLYISNISRDSGYDMKNPEVYVANTDIAAGTEITEDLIGLKMITENINSEKFITSAEDVIGEKTNCAILAGEIISIEKLDSADLKEEKYLRLSSYIPENSRAVNIPVNYYGEKLMIECGDKIDLITTYYDKTLDDLASKTLLSGKEVMLIEGKSDIQETVEGRVGSEGKTESTGIFQDVLGSNIGSSPVAHNVVITLYLSKDEVENVFLALESGVLNMAICPGRQYAGL